ncbi:glycosyltransferase family 4 protein [Patescibacteria group bacterium]
MKKSSNKAPTKNKKLKIAFNLAQLYALPEATRGGIFAPLTLTQDIIEGLVARGHHVTFYGPPGVKTKAQKNVSGDVRAMRKDLRDLKLSFSEYHEQYGPRFNNAYHHHENTLASALIQDEQKGKFDIIHDYHSQLLVYLAPTIKTPTVFTLHDPAPKGQFGQIHFQDRMKMYAKNNYIAISKRQGQLMPGINVKKVIHHGISLRHWKFQVKAKGDYLAFLGRITPKKGLHTAIEVAKQTGLKLRIVGKPFSDRPDSYWAKKIKPQIDGKQIIYDGYHNPKEHKYLSDFLGNAKAFLMPIEWEEPFGLVMIEAMATGTPVIAFKKGSVPEIVQHKKTGFVVNTKAQMINAVKDVDQIKRANCRRHVEKNFSIERMVDDHEKLYSRLAKGK